MFKAGKDDSSIYISSENTLLMIIQVINPSELEIPDGPLALCFYAPRSHTVLCKIKFLKPA